MNTGVFSRGEQFAVAALMILGIACGQYLVWSFFRRWREVRRRVEAENREIQDQNGDRS